MALHQYIGARYVPKFYENSLDPTSSLWESNVTYEPLTVVTLVNEHCYISKKTVPAIIGSPADNSEYWLEVGNVNAYIHDLQDEVNRINDVTIPALENKIDRRYVIIFDSYGDYPNADNIKLRELVASAFTNAEAYTFGGRGFTNVNQQGTFLEALQGLTISSPETVTDIIVLGGQNDYGQNGANIATAINAFVTYCKTAYPNAKVSIGHSSAHRDLVNGTMRDAVYSNYISITAYRACVDYGAIYLNNVEYIMHSSSLYVSGGMNHPNPTGVTRLARGIINSIKTGSTNVVYEDDVTPTAQFGSTYSSVVFSNALFKQIVMNGTSVLRATPLGRITITKAETGFAPTTEFLVGIIDPSTQIIDIVGDSTPSQYTVMPATAILIGTTDNILGTCPACVRWDADDNVRVMLSPGLGTYNSSSVKQIVITGIGEVSIRSINC